LLARPGLWLAGEWPEDVRDFVFRFQSVAKWSIKSNFIDIVSSLLVTNDISGINKVGDNAVNRTFANADEAGNVNQSNFWILGNAQKDMRMVGQECPLWLFGFLAGQFFCHNRMLLLFCIACLA
jgi:hypothetical protein